jgi:hypothetical protein
MPLEYTWGWMGMGRSGSWAKTTSGGSGGRGSVSWGPEDGQDKGRRTDGVLRRESELQSVHLVAVDWVVIEDSDVKGPLLEVVGGHEINAGREAVVELGRRSQWTVEGDRPGCDAMIAQVYFHTFVSSLARRFEAKLAAILTRRRCARGSCCVGRTEDATRLDRVQVGLRFAGCSVCTV